LTAEELGQEPDVHHRTPVRSFDIPEDAHSLDNVVTLCRSCHRNVEEGTIDLD
jgi:5-methylcytosine-specific restriction endonuclease McrA